MPSSPITSQTISYPSIKEIGDKWTQITIDRHKAELKRLKINSTNNLYNSLSTSVVTMGDRGLVATIRYALYGKYVDMGVGRGVAVGARKTAAFAKSRNSKGQLLKYKRKPRPWYSKTIAKEQVILMSILQKYYVSKALEPIVNIPRRIEI